MIHGRLAPTSLLLGAIFTMGGLLACEGDGPAWPDDPSADDDTSASGDDDGTPGGDDDDDGTPGVFGSPEKRTEMGDGLQIPIGAARVG